MGQQFLLAWRSIWRQRRRTLITVISIAFGLFFVIALTTLEEGVIRSVINNGAEMQAGHITIEHEEYRLAPSVSLVVPQADELADELEKLSSVEATKILIGGEGVARSGAGAFGIVIAGVEPSIERERSPLADKIVEGEYLDETDAKRVVIGSVLADRLNLKPGKKLVIATNDFDGELVEQLFRVKGIYRTGTDEIDGALVHMQLASARDLFKLPSGSATQIGVILNDLGRVASILPQVEGRLADQAALSAHPWQTIMPGVAGYVVVERSGYLIMEGFLIALVLFTILNTLLMSVTERKKEFATILALGGSKGALRLQVFFEAALIALLGILVGGLAGAYLAYYYSLEGINLQELSGGMDVDVAGVALDTTIYTLFSVPLLLLLCGAMFIATLILSLVPVSRVGNVSISTLLR